jgi:hypothetical protein
LECSTHHYRVTVIGSVPIKMQLSNSQKIETRKIAFCLRGEIDKTTLHKTAQEVRERWTTERLWCCETVTRANNAEELSDVRLSNYFASRNCLARASSRARSIKWTSADWVGLSIANGSQM